MAESDGVLLLVMLVLLAAVFFAARQIMSRLLSGSDPAVTTVAYTALAGSFVLSIPVPFVWQWPETTLEVGLLVGMASLAALAELLIIKSVEVAQTVVVAPVFYTALIWSTMGFEPTTPTLASRKLRRSLGTR